MDWFESNKLVLNKEKTKTMVLSMRDTTDSDVGNVKYLGVTLDPKLRWDSHGDTLANKLNSCIFLLRNLSHSVSQSVLRSAYLSLFHSVMSYGILFWGHAACRHRLFGLQRKAVRIVGGLKFRDDCRSTFRTQRILTFPSQYILSCLMYVKHNESDFRKNRFFHSYDTRHKDDLSVEYLRVCKSQVGTNYYCIKLYNVLPLKIKELPYDKFIRDVKTVLIENSFYSLDEFLQFFESQFSLKAQ